MYTLVMRKTTVELIEQVNELIADGYEPCGGAFVAENGWVGQALYKRYNNDPRRSKEGLPPAKLT